MIRLPRTTYEQRSPLYKDLESFIIPGFLSHAVIINGVQLNFRSLNFGDRFLIDQRVRDFSENEWMSWSLAASTWMVGGQTTFNDFNVMSKLHEFYSNLPKLSQKKLFSVFIGLMRRTNEAYHGLTSFCYENSSRTLWGAVGKRAPNLEKIVGIPGVESIGLNEFQKIWLSYNELEDQRVKDFTEWQNAKFVASAFSPEGVEKVNKQDLVKLKKDEEDKLKTRDNYFYYKIGLLDQNYEVKNKEAMENVVPAERYIRPQSSPDDLEEEMRAWVAGEYDYHDKIVQGVKDQIIAEHEKHEALKQERLRKLAELRNVEETTGRSPLVGYTPEQLNEIMARKGRKTTSTITDEKGEGYAYRKYIKNKPSSGNLKADRENLKVSEKEKPPSLEEALSNRRVSFNNSIRDED